MLIPGMGTNTILDKVFMLLNKIIDEVYSEK